MLVVAPIRRTANLERPRRREQGASAYEACEVEMGPKCDCPLVKAEGDPVYSCRARQRVKGGFLTRLHLSALDVMAHRSRFQL